MTSTILRTAMRSHWLILAVACGVSMLYLMIGAWQDMAFVSSGERLLWLGLMIIVAFAGGQ